MDAGGWGDCCLERPRVWVPGLVRPSERLQLVMLSIGGWGPPESRTRPPRLPHPQQQMPSVTADGILPQAPGQARRASYRGWSCQQRRVRRVLRPWSFPEASWLQPGGQGSPWHDAWCCQKRGLKRKASPEAGGELGHVVVSRGRMCQQRTGGKSAVPESRDSPQNLTPRFGAPPSEPSVQINGLLSNPVSPSKEKNKAQRGT